MQYVSHNSMNFAADVCDLMIGDSLILTPCLEGLLDLWHLKGAVIIYHKRVGGNKKIVCTEILPPPLTIVNYVFAPLGHQCIICTAKEMIHATIWCAWHQSCVKTVHPITSYGGIIKISLGFKGLEKILTHLVHYKLGSCHVLIISQ